MAGPSGIVPEVLKPDSEAGVVEVRDLIDDITSEGCIPSDWEERALNKEATTAT